MEIQKNDINPHFSLLFWNVRSIKTLEKFTKFKNHITDLVSNKSKIIDCFVVIESWIDDLDNFKLYEFRNYNSYSLSRMNSKGGGIIIYVCKLFVVNIITKMCNQHIEAMLIEILAQNLKQKVLAVYRPPSGNMAKFNEIMDDFFSIYEDLTVVGDMNINSLNLNVCHEYRDMLMMNDYYVVNNSVTRPSSGTLLDHAVMKSNSNALIYTSKNFKLSDHNFVVVLKKITHHINWKHTTVQKSNYQRIREELASIDLMNVVAECPNGNAALTNLINLIKSTVDDSQIIYKIKQKFQNEVPQYVDKKYVKLSNNINNLHDKIRKRKNEGLPVNFLELKMTNLEESLSQHVHIKARDYYSNIIANNRSFSWNIINEITGRRKKNEDYVIQNDDRVIFDKKEIADLFQHKFSTIICDSTNSIRMEYLGLPLINSMRMDAVTDDEIAAIMNELSLKKATGSDGISVRIWKDNINMFVPILTCLVNDMLISGTYPDILKIAAIKPIHKNGIKTNIDNYRGISLLPTINKVFERIIYDKIVKFMTKFEQFDELQYGYRKHFGTQDALCKLYTLISKALDRKKFAVAVFFDISKAFDSIDHKLLLFKLEKLGIRGKALKLIKSYLSNRSQYVKIMDVMSEIAEILFGVPQGSCLGPLLFILMISDLKFLKTNSTILKYADDVVMILTCDKLNDVPGALKSDISKIKQYYVNNGLKLNASKSKYMTFGFSNYNDLDNLMKESGIEKVEFIKYLGVTVDSKLRMTNHVNDLANKISQSSRAMNIIKKHLPTYSLMQFYHAFIGSHIHSNGFLLWRLNTGDINRLQIIQNKSLKSIFGLKSEFPTEKLFKEKAVNILPVLGIACYNLLLMTKKYIITGTEDFEEIDEGRRENQLKFWRFKKPVMANDFICLGPKIYNQLPKEIRDIMRYNQYKKKLKTYLLENKLIFLNGNLNVNKLFNQQNP